jgi:aspartate racemase
MKTIGVIGGMGPQATIDFEKKIHQASNKLITQRINQGYPPMAVFYHRNDPRRTTDSTLYSEKLEPNKGLLEIAKKLGPHADFIVIPTNTAHFFVRQIEEASGLPLLSIVDVTIEKVISLKANTIGVLAIGDTLGHELFQKPLLENHITPVTIPDYLVEQLDKSVWAVMEGTPPEDVKAPVNEAVSYLESQSVDAIILGCSEFALMIEHDLPRRNLIDPIQLLAEKAVEYAIN